MVYRQAIACRDQIGIGLSPDENASITCNYAQRMDNRHAMQFHGWNNSAVSPAKFGVRILDFAPSSIHADFVTGKERR